jgi:hypothetical protein
LKLPADRFSLGLKPGDKVALDADSFQRLAKAFFAEI